MDQSFSEGAETAADGGSQRGGPRDAMLLLADVRRDGETEALTLRVRNLSAGGMMVETHDRYDRGEPVQIGLRNIGLVSGHVAWIAGGRIGIAFAHPVDPREVRRPTPTSPGATMLLMKPAAQQSRRPGLKLG